jgi:hypothetical protein
MNKRVEKPSVIGFSAEGDDPADKELNQKYRDKGHVDVKKVGMDLGFVKCEECG